MCRLIFKAPTAAINSLQSSLTDLGPAAKTAKTGLAKMTANFAAKPFPERAFITTALWTASRNIGSFANAKEDPMGAVVGAVNIVASFAAVFGPTGMLVSAGISFFAGILSMFGKGPQRKSVGEIVREQIDDALKDFEDKSLTDKAQGAIEALSHSKAFLDGVASTGDTISDSEANSLSSHVPAYYGIEFMATLSSVIRRLINNNNVKEAKKCLKYIELYATMATIKDLTLQQFATLLPDSHKNIRFGIYAVQESLREGQASLFGFLYKSEVGNKILPYFDPDIYIITDKYMSKLSKIPNYDRRLAGTYCLTYKSETKSMTFVSSPKQFAFKHPFVTVKPGNNCFWKLVPHGKSLFSIVNRRNCAKDKKNCGSMLSFEERHGGSNTRVNIDHENPVLWEIMGGKQKR